MRKGSTSLGACEVRCWRCLFGNKLPISLAGDTQNEEGRLPGGDSSNINRLRALQEGLVTFLEGLVTSFEEGS